MTHLNGSTRRARLIGLGMLAGAFLAGALSGAAVVRVVSADEPAVRAGAEEEHGRRHSRPNLFDELDLTEEQRIQIEAILERRRKQIDAFWAEFGPKLRAIRDSTRSEIREVLTPEQRELEERLWRARRRHSGREEGKPPKPPVQQEGKQE
ncbi:MAG TPA: hypothetical protein VIL13_01045 [Longimicrobiales bacterium]|jgi:Spy/CpxP family protein refolding chaperone